MHILTENFLLYLSSHSSISCKTFQFSFGTFGFGDAPSTPWLWWFTVQCSGRVLKKSVCISWLCYLITAPTRLGVIICGCDIMWCCSFFGFMAYKGLLLDLIKMHLTRLTRTFSSTCAFLFFKVSFSNFVLPQELQRLEQSNSALQKEIAALKKDKHLYETSLERHGPYCRFRDPSSSDSKASPRSPQASSSLSTSTDPTAGFQTFSYTRQTHFTSSASAPTSKTRPTPVASSSPPSTSCSLLTAPFSTQAAPHSLFCEPPQTGYVNVMPVRPGLVSNPAPSSATRLPSDMLHKTPQVTESSCFPGNIFSMKQDSSLVASSKIQPLISGLGTENTTVEKQDGSVNVPQLYSCQLSRNSNGTHSPLRPPPPQYPGPQTLSVPTQASLVPSPSAVSHQQHASSGPESLLSLLTVPSPITVSQTTSNGMVSQPTRSLPPLPDPSKDYSLSELLEINDWILSGVGYQ